jgi:hypothetical protein
MCLGVDRHNSPAQFRALCQRDTRAKAEKKFPENPMGFDPQKRLAKSNKTSNMQDKIWRELVKLHAVNEEKPTEKFMGRKR